MIEALMMNNSPQCPPRVNDMKSYVRTTIEYYDSIADTYITSGAAVVLEDTIGRFIEALPGSRVLDVGCGPGHDTDYMHRRGLDCTGIDLSEKMIALARKSFRGDYRVMDFFDLKFEDYTFDGIWCSSIFVHVRPEDLPAVLKNACRTLKEGGVLGLITAQAPNRSVRKDDTREYIVYEIEELGVLFGRTGLQTLVAETMTYGGRKRIFMLAKKTRLSR